MYSQQEEKEFLNSGKYSGLIHLANRQVPHPPRAVPGQLFHGLEKGNPRGRGKGKQLSRKGYLGNQGSHTFSEIASYREK